MKHGFLDKYSDLNSPLHSLSATGKLIVFLALILFCVTARADAYLSFAGYFIFLVACLWLSRVPAVHVLRRSLAVLPFLAMAAVSIPFMGGRAHGARASAQGVHPGIIAFQGVAMKSCISVFSVVLLSSVTPFPALLAGMRKLGVPKVFLSLMSFTYRYIFLLVEEVERMSRARDARCYGGSPLRQAKVIGRMTGTFFIRSYERAERVYQAMVSRAFEGRVPLHAAQPMRARDYVFVGGALGLFFCLRIFGASARIV